MNSCKIVYCIGGTYNSGGMERVLANKANWLVEHGYEVIIVTTEQQGRPSFFKFDKRIKFYDLGIGYEDNNGKSFINKLVHYPFKQYRHRKQLDALLQQVKPDITISMFGNEASFVPMIKDGSKKILEIHFSRFKRLQYGRKGLWRFADKWRYETDAKIVGLYDKFVVLTEEDKGYWGNLPNIEVIPNPRTFSVDETALLDSKIVIAVGRLNHQKGFERLIKAWAIVVQYFTDWNLQIIGDGELRDDLLCQIDKLGLSDKVSLNKTETDMVSVYKNASILAMTSHYEGLPMVLLEAQAVGLPIVSFDCKCGPKDVIEDGKSGFLVPNGDIDLFAKKMTMLIKDNGMRKSMGKSAFQNSTRYSENLIMQKWLELFKLVTRNV